MIHFTTLSDLSINIIFSRSILIIDFRSKRLHQRNSIPITITHHQPRNPISLAVLLKPATVKQKINLIDRSMAKLPDPVISNDSTEASIDASIASLKEIQRNWN
jgi:hypothetical protein